MRLLFSYTHSNWFNDGIFYLNQSSNCSYVVIVHSERIIIWIIVWLSIGQILDIHYCREKPGIQCDIPTFVCRISQKVFRYWTFCTDLVIKIIKKIILKRIARTYIFWQNYELHDLKAWERCMPPSLYAI